jgi:hypothetical protein
MATSTNADRAPRRLTLPAGIDLGTWSGQAAVLAAGAALGAAILVIPAFLSAPDAFGFLAVLLGMIAGVYLGFALQDGRVRAFRTEYVGIVAHGALATIALVTESAAVLAGGYLGHALWDAVHHPRGLDTVIPRWYVPLCIGYDVVVGAYVLIRF